jgi:uncharacterized protein with GYD domain
MAMFFMFGRYSIDSVQNISAQRTQKAREIIQKHGGEIQSIYALLGKQDLALIVSLPGLDEAMKASVALTKTTGISFSTSPAVAVEEFDTMMKDS